ncbi:2-oxoacid:acceptor oxidoreductase family protein [Fusibacter sp. 3D3]|uniref:2-oxoacid:acceptor oxidoreductase family protein n=1 Tax=Fusibacter sp. 3D3 TaxID=1048380 RepID=UPI000852E5E0|nr:2-oxoacid:acceptor oxidoreductase family protein [Fusibacter sp. 3D3]GAU77141.1 2-oxoglutarate oxidoreductase, gamma subunit [Fusibacter sp. 3D3]
MLNEKVICAGFGGQGVMLIGQLISYAGMLEGKEVSWLPSYGPEMRGGTANCSVMVSERTIGSPVITNDATTAIVMNLPSLDKFENDIAAKGNILINSSLIEKKATRSDIVAYYVPANEIAGELGNSRVANMVMLGAYLELTKTVEVDSVMKALNKIFGEGKAHLLDVNRAALEKGAKAIKA